MAADPGVRERRRHPLLRRFYGLLLPAIRDLDSTHLRDQIYRAQAIAFLGVVVIFWALKVAPELIYRGDLKRVSGTDWMELAFITVWMLLLLAFALASTHVFLKRMRYLEGFLPVCSFCKGIRVEGQWETLEHFVARRSNLRLTHSLCPNCAKRHYDHEEEAAAPVECSEQEG